MYALRLYGKEDLRYEEINKPACPKGGLLIEVKACAICGTDLRIYLTGGTAAREMKFPAPMGHEVTGIIHKMDTKLEGFKIGDPVVLPAIYPCNRCEYCLRGSPNRCDNKKTILVEGGGFSEYLPIPSILVERGLGMLRLPNKDFFIPCTLTEPLSDAINGQELSKVGLGDIVVIMGGGPLGVMHATLAKINGAKKVILSETVPERLKLLQNFKDIDILVDSSKEDIEKRVMKETNGRGADVIIVACPSKKAQEESFKLVAKRGRINFFGGLPKEDSKITVDSNLIHYKEIFVHGSSDADHYQFQKAYDLITSGRINTNFIISKIMPLKDYREAFNLMLKRKVLKIVLVP
jgi:L-iditol 2-dehydrogenase